jgi:hypothetical protein
MQKPKQNKIWKVNNVMSINNQGFLFKGPQPTRLHTHKQTLHKTQRIWKQDTPKSEHVLLRFDYVPPRLCTSHVKHCTLPLFKIHLSMIESQKKNPRKDKAYQHWIVYIIFFFARCHCNFHNFMKTRNQMDLAIDEIASQFNNNPTSKFQSTLHYKWHN